jgi:hypothetical protein
MTPRSQLFFDKFFFQFFREPTLDYPTNTQQVRQKKFIDLKIA